MLNPRLFQTFYRFLVSDAGINVIFYHRTFEVTSVNSGFHIYFRLFAMSEVYNKKAAKDNSLAAHVVIVC